MGRITIRTVSRADAADWERMRQELWPSAAGEHAGEIATFLGGDKRDPAEVLLACDENGKPVGFAELTLRSHAEGCRTEKIAYLEGWYVVPEVRRQGVGAALMRAAEDWGRTQGCTEMASDTNLENAISEQAHKSLGFDEADRIICFRKSLEPRA